MNHGSHYELADKMKDRFGSRGSAVSGMQASTTSELMRRAEREYNPNGNASEAAFRENYMRHRGATASGNARKENGRPSGAGNRSGEARRPHGTQYQQSHRNPHVKSAQQTAGKPKAAPAPEPQIVRPEPVAQSAEIRTEKKAFPVTLLLGILIIAVIFMALVSGMSKVYQSNREIARLEKQLEQLEETAEQLELRLEDKNDVKTIEAMASERLGMVKEEYVQKEYISLSDGERIELIDSGEEESSGGVMLSSVFSALGDFFERFK